METNLAEDINHDKAILAGIALEQHKRQQAEIRDQDKYTTRMPPDREVNSEYSATDRPPRDDDTITMTISTSDDLWQEGQIEVDKTYIVEDAVSLCLYSMTHKLDVMQPLHIGTETEPWNIPQGVFQLIEDKRISEIITYARSQLDTPFSEQLADRLEFLVEIAKEEDPDEITIVPESLKTFIDFLQSQTNLKYPDVVLTPDKNIRVRWRTAPNQHFAVEFLPTEEAIFVIFAPDPHHPEKTTRLSGRVSVDSLIETVQPHGVLDWSTR